MTRWSRVTTTTNEQGNRRTRKLVVEVAVVDIWDEDTRVVITVGAGEGDQLVFLWFTSPTTTDGKLRARWVKLCATHADGELECDDFMTNEVVSGGNVGRKVNASRGTSH